MKQKLLFLFILFYGFTQAQVFVPDDNFEQALIDLGYDDALDDYVSQINIITVTSLDVSYRGILDLTGINGFLSLEELDCGYNALTSLDISDNIDLTHLDCNSNLLTELDVTGQPALISLGCDNNQLTSLDLSQNTELVYLDCSANQITSLDVTMCPSLFELECQENSLSSLLTNNPVLETLMCYDNNLSSLNVSGNMAMKQFWCYENNLTSLDVSQNTALEGFGCHYNQLSEIDITNNTALLDFDCTGNQLTELNVTQNTALTFLSVRENNLTELYLDPNTALETLECNNNQIAFLDLTSNVNLAFLECFNNALQFLNVKNGNNSVLGVMNALGNSEFLCIAVDDVDQATAAPQWLKDESAIFHEFLCQIIVNSPTFKNHLLNNPMVNTNNDDEIQVNEARAYSGNIDCSNLAIDDLTGIENFISISGLDCSNNLLTTLDFEPEGEARQFSILDVMGLTALNCSGNQIESLDISMLSNLTDLNAQNNALTQLNAQNGNNVNFNSFLSIGNENLECIQVDDATWAAQNFTGIDPWSSFSIDCNYLSVSPVTENLFTLYPNPSNGTVNFSETVRRVSFFDTMGRILLKSDQSAESLSTQSLMTGTYFVRGETVSGETFSLKLIVR